MAELMTILTGTDDGGEVLLAFDRLVLDEPTQRLVLGSHVTITDQASGDQRQLQITNLRMDFVA